MARQHTAANSSRRELHRLGYKRLLCTALMSALAFGASASEDAVFSANFGAPEQPTADGSLGRSEEVSSSGVVRSTGNRTKVELDFTAQGELPLQLRRVYNHLWSAIGVFGGHWLSNFDYSLATSAVGSQTVLWLQRPDGRRIKFLPSATANRWNEDKAQAVAYVDKLADGTYVLRNEERGTSARKRTYGGRPALRATAHVGGPWPQTHFPRATNYSGRLLQLFECACWPDAKRCQALLIVGAPEAGLKEHAYLAMLRERFGVPVHYLQYYQEGRIAGIADWIGSLPS